MATGMTAQMVMALAGGMAGVLTVPPTTETTGLHVREAASVEVWDAAVWAHPQGSIFAASSWGRYKERRGWRIRRLTVTDDAGALLALAQVQVKRRGPGRLVHIEGGPLLTEKGARRAEAVLGALLDPLAPSPFDLVLIDFARMECAQAVLGLLAKGFAPVTSAGRHTLDVDLRAGLDAILAAMEPRWRKALRKAERTPGLTARFLDDPAERLAAYDAFTAMYAGLKARKGFANDFDCAAYRDLVAADPRHLILEVRENGERVLVRIAHLSRTRCTDFFTASTERAKANGAATLAVWRLVERAAAEDCDTFDFGGIDPATNRGVFDFKRGLTRQVTATGPVWLRARSQLLQAAAGLMLARR